MKNNIRPLLLTLVCVGVLFWASQRPIVTATSPEVIQTNTSDASTRVATDTTAAAITPNPVSTEVTTPNVTEKTYVSKLESFTITYPTEWQLTTMSGTTSVLEGFSLKGPNHFLLTYKLQDSEKHSDYSCDGCDYDESTVFTPAGYGGELFVTVVSRNLNGQTYQRLGISETAHLNTQVDGQYAYYPAKSLSTHNVVFTGYYYNDEVAGGEIGYSSYGDFRIKSEVEVARTILKSIRYIQ